MAKLFSVASWNVEHFKDDPSRIARVVDFVKAQNPDVFGLYEVEGAMVFDALVGRMPGYTFQITEGPETQEILVGVRKTLTAFITQKVEFRSGTTSMRPGQLVTITIDGTHYALLFLHLASGNDPRGMGLRDDMLERAFEFRRTLDKAAGGEGKARYMFLGDLNTMGMDYPFDRSIVPDIELRKWDRYAAQGHRDAPPGQDPPGKLDQRQREPDSAVEPRPRVRLGESALQGVQGCRRVGRRCRRARLGGGADGRAQGCVDRALFRPLAPVSGTGRVAPAQMSHSPRKRVRTQPRRTPPGAERS